MELYIFYTILMVFIIVAVYVGYCIFEEKKKRYIKPWRFFRMKNSGPDLCSDSQRIEVSCRYIADRVLVVDFTVDGVKYETDN